MAYAVGLGLTNECNLAGDNTAPDPFCPIVRPDALQLTARMATRKVLLKAGSACTTILSVDDHGSAAP